MITKALHGSKKPRSGQNMRRGWQAEPFEAQGRLASMWIHLNRVRSTFSKSRAETSGRFLSHKTERTKKWQGEAGQDQDPQQAAGALMPGPDKQGRKLDLQPRLLRLSSGTDSVPRGSYNYSSPHSAPSRQGTGGSLLARPFWCLGL